jgi:hypothetical protein
VPLRWDTPLVGRVLDRHAGRVADATAAADLRWISGYISIKEPGSHRGAPREPLTLPVRAGDAAVIDYRLEHGTHANATHTRRDCLILNFAPDWAALPGDIRGHLIQHPALPGDGEPASPAPWLPRYDGPRRDLPLNRTRYVTPSAPASAASSVRLETPSLP